MIVASVDTVRALVAPLVPGDVVAGWRLESGMARDDGAVVYRLARAGEGWDVVVAPLDAAAPAWARTKHLNVTVSSDQALTGLSQSLSSALRELLAVLERNDVPLTRPTPAHAPAFTGAKPTLWLAPGHIGDPRDLSLRALDLLDRCALWVVEAGKADLVRAMLPPLGVPTSARAIHEVADGDSVESILAVIAPYLGAQRDVCLFGADEGVPGFIDPGARVLEAAARCGAAVRSVGGASVLGTALMRVDQWFETFTFIGHAGMGWTDQALYDELARSPRPLVFFTTGAWCRESAGRLGRAVARRRGTIRFLCDLTEAGEAVVRWEPHLQRAAPEIPGEKVVVFIGFGPGLPERIVRRIRKWWQRA